MSETCNSPLGNFGQSCELDMSEIKRILFVSKLDANGDANKITKVLAATKAGWQARFDKPNFDADVLEKVVSSPILFEVASEQADPSVFDNAGYYKKLRDGDYNINFSLNDIIAKQIGSIKSLEESNFGVFLVDADSKVWGYDGRTIGDADNLYPLSIQNIAVPNFNLASFETISQEIATMRLDTPSDVNQIVSVQIADALVSSDADFFSLTDVSTAVASPATTGAVVTLTETQDGSAVTGFVFGDFIFYDQAAPLVPITLAGAGSITESPDGVYTINEVALLSSSTTYDLKITKTKYDVEVGTVIVP